jgi:hypothetical protein
MTQPSEAGERGEEVARYTEQSPLLNTAREPQSNGNGIAKDIVDEEERLGERNQEQGNGKVQVSVVKIISVLLIGKSATSNRCQVGMNGFEGLRLKGIFVANADGSMLLATHATIASEFNDLTNSTWLITSFALAGAATQTLVCNHIVFIRVPLSS